MAGSHYIYINEWFKKGVVSIKDLLNNDGNFLTFKEFSDKYGCQTNFLRYYQIISAIPNRLLTKAKDVGGTGGREPGRIGGGRGMGGGRGKGGRWEFQKGGKRDK